MSSSSALLSGDEKKRQRSAVGSQELWLDPSTQVVSSGGKDNEDGNILAGEPADLVGVPYHIIHLLCDPGELS